MANENNTNINENASAVSEPEAVKPAKAKPEVSAKKLEAEKAKQEKKAAKAAKEMEKYKARREKEMQNASKKGISIPYERRKSLYGYGFIAIWFIGSIYFFIIPLINSFIYSFHFTEVKPGHLQMTFIGFENYVKAFREDTAYAPALLEVLQTTALKTPLIIVFSIFIAVILNQKFRGRTFARAIFFLPVIIATGPVIRIINGNMDTSGYSGGAEQFSTMFETNLVGELLNFIGVMNINQTLTNVINTVTSDIFNLVWNAGIQILLFLAALQNIPYSAKEAAQIEGATGWEYFWKITIPYISPMILASLIYTIVDSFVDPSNQVMTIVLEKAAAWEHGYSAAMAWAYFLVVIVALGIVVPIVNKFVYYEV